MLFTLTLLAALGSGVIAGVFFAFSSFIMRALARLPDGEGIAAMQAINVTVLNAGFLGLFFGTAAACLALVAYSVLRVRDPAAVWLFVGGLLYLVGTILVTMRCNVPRNRALASVARADKAGSSVWAAYVRTWTRWNHVRTAAALAAAAAFSVALGIGPAGR